MTGVRLYSRPDCHLCEYALELLAESGLGIEAERINVEADAQLLERYNVSIPVFQRIDTGAELFWPFDDDDLLEFLAGLD